MNMTSHHLETLTEIRSMMERSTRFISLNGLAGVFAGVFALMGAIAAYFFMEKSLHYSYRGDIERDPVMYAFFIIDAISVLFASVAVAVFLSVRKARRKGLKVWDHMARRVTVNMFVPLATGGIFCFILLIHGMVGFIAPAMLIFYGLALFNTSKYTYSDIRVLGLFEILLGLLSSIWVGYGLIFWAMGFGVLHIIYGIVLYYKYER